MWKNVAFVQKELSNRGYSVGPIICGAKNCVLIGGKLKPAHYHTPEFGFTYGVVGCTLDGIQYTVAIMSRTISEIFLKETIENFPLIALYGGKNFKRDFYPTSKVPKEILKQIKMSKEENVQLGITLENPWDKFKESSIELLDTIEKIVKKLRVHKIKVVNPLLYPKYRRKS